MSFELEFSTGNATSAAEALVASIDKIAPSLDGAAKSLGASTKEILTSLNAIRATSKGVATDFASIAASMSSVQRAALTELEKTNAQQLQARSRMHSEALRMNNQFNKDKMAQDAAALAAYNRQLDSNMSRVVRTHREAQAEIARISAQRIAQAQQEAEKLARINAETDSAWRKHNSTQASDLAKSARQKESLWRQVEQSDIRSLSSKQEQERQLWSAHEAQRQAAAEKARREELRAQSAADKLREQEAARAQSQHLRTQKAAHAAELAEEKKQAGLLQHAERDRHRVSIQNQQRFFSQSAAAFRAGMIATGSSFGIFTSSTILTAAAVYALVASFKAAIVIGAQFEHTMAKALAVMEIGRGSSLATQITDQVRDLARTTQFTAVQVAEGLVFLGMAGLDASQSMQALAPSLNIAAIGMVDMAFAADLITNVMNEFHMQAQDLGHIADVLAKASVDANVSIQELGTSLSYVGPVAATSNNSLEATAALISVLGDNAIKGSRAGTTLRGSINDLLDPTTKATETLLRLGVRTKTVSGEMLPLIDIVNQLASVGAESKDLSNIFDLRSLAGMTVLVKDAAKGFDESGRAIDGYVSKAEQYEAANIAATGSADELRKVMEDTLKVDALLLKSAFADQMISAFDSIGDRLRLFVQGWTEFVLAISPEKMQEIANGIAGVVSTLGTLAAVGAGIYATVKAVQLLSWAWGTASVAAIALSGNASLIPAVNTSAALSMEAAAASATRQSAAMFGASAAARTLMVSLGLLQRAFIPLAIIGTITTLFISYQNASSGAAESSSLMRAEMALQTREAGLQTDKLKELNAEQEKRRDLQSQGKIAGNREATAALRAEIADLEKDITRKNAFVAETTEVSVLRGKVAHKQELIEQLEEESRLLAAGLDTQSKVTAAAEARAAAEKKTADAARVTSTAYMEALLYVDRMLTLQAQGATTYVTDPSSRPLSMSLSAATEFEVENSKLRIQQMEDELSVKESLQDAHINKTLISMDDNASAVQARERHALDLRKQYAEDNFNTAKKFLDAELKVATANKDALRKQMSAAFVGDDGLALEAVIPEYKAAADYINELLQKREELVAEYSVANAEMLNSQLEFDVETKKSIQALAESYDPLLAAETLRKDSLRELDGLLAIQAISEAAHAKAVERTEEAYRAVLFPVDVFIQKAREKIALEHAEASAVNTGNFSLLSRLTLQKEFKDVTEEQIASYANLLRSEHELAKSNKRLQDQARLFERSWVQAVDRVDDAVEELWKSGLKGFDGFTDKLKEGFLQLLAFMAHQAITKPVLIQLGLTPEAFAAGFGGGTAGVPGVLSSLLPGIITQGAGWLGGAAADGVEYLANLFGAGPSTQLTSEAYVKMMQTGKGSVSALPTGLDAVKSGLYGLAGGWAGTKVGESLFNKQAESSWGASIGGVLGALTPLGPIGAALGAAIGGMVDAAFGGDGKKRYSAGFSVGAPAVKSQYEYGTTTFDSGLTVTNIARRVDQSVSDKVTDYFKELDSAFSSVTRGAGINLDLRGWSGLSGSTADAGIGGQGPFWGLKDYNGLGDEAALKAQGVDFVRQLIAHVTADMGEDIRKAVTSATGTAEELLTRYADVLSLDQIFRSGNKVFSNITDFGATLKLLDEQFKLNDESLSATAARVLQANEALSALGLGDGSDTSAALAMSLADAAGGVDNFTAMVSVFADTVAWEEQSLEESVGRLRNAVSAQFSDLGLVLESFDLLTFKQHFEDVKESVDAVELVNLIRAGNALALLVEQEKELAEVREKSYSVVNDLIKTQSKHAAEARTVAGSLADDLAELSGVFDLPEISGSVSERLSAIDTLREHYLDQYQEQLRLEQNLHDKKVENYKALTKAAEKITDDLRDIQFSDLSPLPSKQRRDDLLSEFEDLYAKAMAGDASAASKVSGVGKEFLTLERERETISPVYLSSYADITGRLSTLKDVLEAVQDPGEFSDSEATATVAAIQQLQSLQSSAYAIQGDLFTDMLSEITGTNLALDTLPEDIAASIREAFGPTFIDLLQIGVNLGALSGRVAELSVGLGLLPKVTELNSVSIATQVNNLTRLSEFPTLLAKSLSDTVGEALLAMAKAGLPVPSIADSVAQNPVLTDAWNEYAAGNNLGPVSQYQSKVNPAITNQNIMDTLSYVFKESGGKLSLEPALREKQVTRIHRIAAENGVGSSQIASALSSVHGSSAMTSQQINQLVMQYGLPAFGDGGLVRHSTIAAIAERGVAEYVAPVDKYAVVERQHIVRDIARVTAQDNQALIAAVEENTAAVNSAGGSKPITVVVVTQDGKVLVEETITAIRNRSENDEYVVHVRGVRDRA